MKRVITEIPKLRYCIKKVLGDFYYKDMPIDVAIEHTFISVPEG